MSDYYKGKRTRNLYDPEGVEPFRLSRSKIDLYLNCPRCFYLQVVKKISRPAGIFPSLPSGVDKMLKEHFDGKRDNRKSIWTLFMFELWRKKYLN